MMALHQPQEILSARHAPSWVLLTMAAGAVNTGGFLACRRFVTHVTGTVTQLGMDSANLRLVGDTALVLGCFVAGAMASVLAIDVRHHRGQQPLYALPLVVVASLLSLVSLMGLGGAFGPFGGTSESFRDVVMLSALCFAMGLQNASVATSTGALVRTTHLTGPSTDLGVHFARFLFTDGEQRVLALKHTMLRLAKVVGFAGGAVLMVPAAESFGYLAFLLPAAMILAATALSFVPSWLQTTTAPDLQRLSAMSWRPSTRRETLETAANGQP